MALTHSAIHNAFRTALARDASEAELANYAHFESSAELTSALYLEPEYATSVLPVARLYSATLGRDPDAGGLNFFVDAVRDIALEKGQEI